MANLDTFITMTHKDFPWPFPKPILLKPTQPPMDTGTRLYLPRPDEEDCKCDMHGLLSDKDRYIDLADKERRLRDELGVVNNQMRDLLTTMLESTCEPDDETMKTVYEVDYRKRGLRQARYRSIIAAIDSPICSPIGQVVADLRSGYKDPTRFRHSALERPTIQPAKTIHFLAVPESFQMWEQPFIGRSEYMDNISKLGLSNLKNRQQYREPLPSSRRRFGDCKL